MQKKMIVPLSANSLECKFYKYCISFYAICYNLCQSVPIKRALNQNHEFNLIRLMLDFIVTYATALVWCHSVNQTMDPDDAM